MIDVKVSISGIIMCCDESLCRLALGRGYTIEKCDLDTLFYKDKITNGRGNLDTDYFGSRIIEDEKVFFICIKKDDVIQIEGPNFSASKRVISDKDCMCEDELEQYMDTEMEYLNERINLLRLFKPGNIGLLDVFFHYSFTVMGFIKTTVDHCSHNQTRNTIASDRFTLNEAEVILCNQWLNDYCNMPYDLLKNSIDEFSWGLEQIDIPTGLNPDTRVKDLTEDEVNAIRDYIKTLNVEGDLRREVALNIKRLQEIGCYRGIRHRRGLPVRGQKTKTNARTRKGPKKTVGRKKK